MDETKVDLDRTLRPGGYIVGWVGVQGVSRSHLRVIPRFRDEPLVDRGVRDKLEQSEKKRP